MMKLGLITTPTQRTLIAGLLLAACSDPATTTSSATASSSALPSSQNIALESAIENELSTEPPEILKYQWTSAVKARNPVDQLDHAKAGERVYVHMTIRNRTKRPRAVSVTFSVNGKPRTENVELEVAESWSYRTWAYVTLRKDDKGTLTVSVVDDAGNPLIDDELPIR